MNQILSHLLSGLAGTSLFFCYRYYRQIYCVLFFGEPDFSKIEKDLFTD